MSTNFRNVILPFYIAGFFDKYFRQKLIRTWLIIGVFLKSNFTKTIGHDFDG